MNDRFGHSFKRDRFQEEAIAALDRGENVLVAAPTGSGKTVVAEHAVSLALDAGARCFYTAPIKALSNQKYNDLVAALGSDSVGLLTGDHAINSNAPVVVMTTEVLRNMVYAGSDALDGLAWVVLDEVHFLADAYRGPVWEEVLIHTPLSVKFVCLSATVSNATELGEWIEKLRGTTSTVIEHERPIELDSALLVGDRVARDDLLVPLLVDGRPNPDGRRFDADRPSGPPGRYPRTRSRYFTPRRVETIEILAAEDMLPAIYFIFSRNGCDEAASRCFQAGLRLTDESERERIRRLAELRTETLSDGDLEALGYEQWLAALEQGIASHHAGMVPAFREAVEDCFVEGLVKAVFATETLALGINMPARTVVIEKLSKFNGERHEFLSAGLFTQLTGRAGRRGIDDEGHAVVHWSPFTTFTQVANLAASREFPLVSSFRPTYNMAANLVDRYSRDTAFEILGHSFAQFQAERSVARMAARRVRLTQELDAIAEERAESVPEAVFDVSGYAALLDKVRSTRTTAKQAAEEFNLTLASLTPGDVLEQATPSGVKRVVVVSVSTRKGGTARVRCVDKNAKTVWVDRGYQSGPTGKSDPHETNEWGSLTPVGRVELPVPYLPKDPEFRRAVAALIRRMNPKRGAGRKPHRNDLRGSTRGDEESLSNIRALIEEHPLHTHPDREALLSQHLSSTSVARQLKDLDAEISRRGTTLADQLESILGVLTQTGHLDGWSLTPAGERLRRIYHESDLLLSLSITDGLFDGLTPPEVAALLSCFTHEHRSSEPPPAPILPSVAVRDGVTRLRSLWKQLERLERAAKVPQTREPQPGFADAAWSWASGGALEMIIDEDLSGGDFVRNIRQLIDLLAQLGEVAISPETGHAARSAAESLRRGVIVASGGPG
ncbi:MAG: DEAD/DEAH box helicase [Microthrixaceae bacterium]